jgi:hypothetical protein
MVSASPEVRSFGKELGQHGSASQATHTERRPVFGPQGQKRQSRRQGGGCVGGDVYTPYGRFDMSRLLTKRLVLV